MLDVRRASGNEKPVLGISEWMCYYANYDKACPGPWAHRTARPLQLTHTA